MMTGNGFVEERVRSCSKQQNSFSEDWRRRSLKNLLKIVLDGKTVFHHSEDHSDLRKTIDDFSVMTHNLQMRKSIEVTAILKEGMHSIVIVKIMKIHKKKDHAVDLQIKGGIKEEMYHTFKNYLTEKLGLKELEY